MVCDTRPRLASQTLAERKEEVKKVVSLVERALAEKRVAVRVGPQGAITFAGLLPSERADVSDACIYRRIMSTGSALSRAAVARAEQMAGRSVDRQAVAQGHHSHDGGRTWSRH